MCKMCVLILIEADCLRRYFNFTWFDHVPIVSFYISLLIICYIKLRSCLFHTDYVFCWLKLNWTF